MNKQVLNTQNSSEITEPKKTAHSAVDEERFREIYDRYHLKIFNYIAKTIGNREDALDLLQELFLLFYDRLPRLDTSTGRIEAWLLRVARNMCLSFSRSRARHMTKALNNIEPAGDSNSEVDLLKKDFHKKVHYFLDHLNDQERSIFILHKMEGMKYRDLMKIFDISQRTLKRIVASVLARMKEQGILERDDLVE
ncbi:MAG: sigma-70 family RNA polymerase sigma factor [Leptospiraceae bacterium]|nr:sigma-70 family RNA polymerase sigma factor [Leptospiraceae bacterium]MCB1199087.1 sigma-70 family RNA polymerase sigma factor [Leptospiraceae bacterium]